jgi:hypothetical protein
MPPGKTTFQRAPDYRASFQRFKAPRKDPGPKKEPGPKKDPDPKKDAESKVKTPPPPAYEPWVRCLEPPREHPDWEDREWFVGGGLPCPCALRHRWMTRWAEKRADEIQEVYGGRWCGVVRVVNDDPCRVRLTEAQINEVYDHILNGPEGPGRQWLLRRKGGAPCAPSAIG